MGDFRVLSTKQGCMIYIILDGFDNAGLIARANELIQTARREMKKASTLQRQRIPKQPAGNEGVPTECG